MLATDIRRAIICCWCLTIHMRLAYGQGAPVPTVVLPPAVQSAPKHSPPPAHVSTLPPLFLTAIRAFLPFFTMEAERRRGMGIRDESARAAVNRPPPGRRSRRPRRPFGKVQRFLSSNDFVKQLSLSARINLDVLRQLKSLPGLNLNSAEIMQIAAIVPPQRMMRRPPPSRSDSRPPRPPRQGCPYPMIVCDSSSVYRSIDGSCNNLNNGHWGRTYSPLRRLLKPQYGDGFNSPRLASNGGPLPSPRRVSLNLFEDAEVSDHVQSLSIMTFGQFLDHDMDRTAIASLFTDVNGTSGSQDVDCGTDGCQTDGMGMMNCFPIPIPPGDLDFSGQQCLEFVRSESVPPLSCALGPREQLNQITSYLDSSNVYGSLRDDSSRLRANAFPLRGALIMTHHPYDNRRRNLLPVINSSTCADVNVGCFVAGDGRVNEQVSLTSFHTIFAREHNRIEANLAGLNPQWSGETKFQEARRILNAQWQYIVYTEYLPLILGPEVMAKYDLNLLNTGYFTGYDPSVNAAVSNEFATAAFRFGHSMIGDKIRLSDYNHNPISEPQLSTVFENTTLMYDVVNGGLDSILRGLADIQGLSTDQFFSKQITAHLFTPNPPYGVGTDLTALNIQRGRDHGIPDYNSYRELCGMPKATSFAGLSNEIRNATIRAKLQATYASVDDIDLFAGAVVESRLHGASVGPTFACILAKQFQRSRRGDRFWHENARTLSPNSNPHPFTEAQLSEIRKTSLAHLICDNGDNIGTIQPRVFLLPRRQANPSSPFFQTFSIDKLYYYGSNERVPCSTLPGVDLRMWRA